MKKVFLFFLLVYSGAYAQSRVKFTAKIQNRHSDTLSLRRIDLDGLQFNMFKAGMISDADGNFEGVFMMEPGIYHLFDGKEFATVYVEDRYDLKMEMDAKMFDETISFKGRGSGENNFLAKKFLIFENLENSMGSITDHKTAVKKIDSVLNVLHERLDNSSFQKGFKKEVTKLLRLDRLKTEEFAKRTVKKNNLKGKVSPDFKYDNFAGGKTQLKDLSGKYVYIDIWATWCKTCLEETPYIQRLVRKYTGKNIEFVSISVEMDKHKWKEFEKKFSLRGIRLHTGRGMDSSFILDYGISDIPRYILLDPTGKVLDPDAKRPSDTELQRQLDNLLD